MSRELTELIAAAGPFGRVANIIDALPPSHRCDDDMPMRDAMPGEWPTVGELRRLRNAMRAIGRAIMSATDVEVIIKMRAIARAALEQT
jgi:hypothetical protein